MKQLVANWGGDETHRGQPPEQEASPSETHPHTPAHGQGYTLSPGREKTVT